MVAAYIKQRHRLALCLHVKYASDAGPGALAGSGLDFILHPDQYNHRHRRADDHDVQQQPDAPVVSE